MATRLPGRYGPGVYAGTAAVNTALAYAWTRYQPLGTVSDSSTLNPQLVTQPETEAGPGQVDLAVHDLTHAHTVNSVTVTQAHALTAADLTHRHSVSTVTIAIVVTVTPADLAHSHTVDPVTIGQAHQLVPSGLAHGHTIVAVSR